MTYTLLFLESDDAFAARIDERQGEYWGAWTSYIDSISEAGIMRGGQGLQPPTAATTVRIENGKRLVQDGPFADTKEQLGGFLMIEVPTIDQALEWASKSPALPGGSVEIRPILEMAPQ